MYCLVRQVTTVANINGIRVMQLVIHAAVHIVGCRAKAVEVGATRQRGGGHAATHFRKGVVENIRSQVKADAPDKCDYLSSGSSEACCDAILRRQAHQWRFGP